MGEVYRARDPNLGREVAIKVLPESLAQDPAALARFKVEARALAALSHPNILGIYDLGSAGDVSFVVMELLEGETLREKLKDGMLPQRKAIEYAREIARGLSAAHAKGIVHRDLKPDNVFITKDERVKILDFGLAKRAEKAPLEVATLGMGPPPSPTTEAGVVLGTLGYMAPEQLRGLPVDHRADIFALGAILYELLTGKRAFRGATPSDTISAILRDEPPALSQPGAIPAGLGRIVRYCLEKSPEARAHSAQDVAFQLDMVASFSEAVTGMSAGFGSADVARRRVAPLAIAAAIVVLCVLAVAVALWRRAAAAPAVDAAASAAEAGVKRLAVLPFENLGSKDDDYFADGITDEVRGKLTSVPGLALIARTSSIGYRNTTKTPQEIGNELDVEYLLTGTVRFVTDASGARRVQVSPELVLAGSAESKWAQPFDATLTDVFRVQGEIATEVAEALGVALSPGSRKSLDEKPTQSLPAYEAYLRGEDASQGMMAYDPPSLRRALQQYERAVALDGGFVEAWGRLSSSSSLLYRQSTPTPALAARARQAAAKAVELDPEHPDGHQALSLYYRFVFRDGARALAEAERARALAPGDAFRISAVAFAEQLLGRWKEALGHLEEARHLDPRSTLTLRFLGDTAAHLRRTTAAREAFDAALSLAPSNISTRAFRALTDVQEGDLLGARAVLKAAPPEVDRTALVAYLATWRDLVWLLDEGQRDLLLRLTPSAFDDDRGSWAIGLAQAYALRHDEPNVRKHAEIARAAFAEQLAAVPQNALRQASHALSLAYLGRRDEAMLAARRAAELAPIAKDAYYGPYIQQQVVRVYILVGEHDKAIDELETLLEVPCLLTPGWLRIDPSFDPLRSNPRFAELVKGRASGTAPATR